MQKILISLVISTYNRASFLFSALESVAASVVNNLSEFEVIVVDNNSTDDTRQTVEQITSQGFPFTLRYVFEARQGISHARNRGTSEAKGFYIAFMDDDQLMDKHYLAMLNNAFEETQAVCVGGPLIYYNDSNLPAWLPPLLEYVGQFHCGDQIKPLSPGAEMLRGGNIACIRQELIDIGGYDPQLGRCGNNLLANEENELQERFCWAGKKVMYHPSLIQYHYLRPERLKKHYWRRHQFDKGRTVYRYKSSREPDVTSQLFMGAPRWFWWFLVTKDVPRYARALIRSSRKERFDRQLSICFRLGQIYEARQINKAEAKAGEAG